MNSNKLYAPLCHNSSLPPPAVFKCENWSTQQVSEWLRGVDDGIAPYLGHFIALDIDGSKLENIDSDSLKRIGINKEATRIKIIAAVNLLLYYSHSIKFENLQKLSLKASLASNELLNAVSQATPVIRTSSNVSKHIEMLNAVLRALAETYEATVRLIFWLERNPFVGNKKFARLRNTLTALVDQMVDCVNNPNNPKFFSVPQVLVDRAHSIRRICKEIIHMQDPSVLYTAFLERITIRRPTNSDWGFEVGRTCFGVNLITRVDYNSPAAFSDKFDVGDEILEIDGCPVVGWKHSNVLRRLNSKILVRPGHQQFPSLSGNVTLQLLLSKRPRENGSPQRPPKMPATDNNSRGEQENKLLTKLALDFKNKIGTDFSQKWRRQQQQPQSKEDGDHLALRRARSHSFTVSANASSRRCSECSLPQTSRCISLLMPSGKQPLFRRASVWNESPPATLRSPFEGFQSESNSWLLLLASWGGTEGRAKVGEKTDHRVQQKPPPLTGIFEAGGISVLIEEDEEAGKNSTDPRNLIDPRGIVFASVEVVQEMELLKIGAVESATILEPEWTAPIREITGLQTQRAASFLDSGNPPTAIIIDSPLSNIHAKIARFFYGDVVVSSPNPTASNCNSPHPAAAIGPSIMAADLSAVQTPAANSNKLIFQRQLTNSECKTPITPNSKFSLDLPLSTASKPGEESSSLCSVDSPSSYSTIVRTIGCRYRLAPLAEPDEVGDLLSAYEPEGERMRNSAEVNLGKLLELSRLPAHDRQQDPALAEGWLRRELLPLERKRQPFRASFRRKRWIRCWALIRDGRFLCVYPNQTANEADLVCDLGACSLMSGKAEFRTSKKHTFLLKCAATESKLHFAPYSLEDLNSWMEQIRSLARSPTADVPIPKKGRRKNQAEPAIFVRHEFDLCVSAGIGEQTTSSLVLEAPEAGV